MPLVQPCSVFRVYLVGTIIIVSIEEGAGPAKKIQELAYKSCNKNAVSLIPKPTFNKLDLARLKNDMLCKITVIML